MIYSIRVLNCSREAKDLEVRLREGKGLNDFLKIFVRIWFKNWEIYNEINDIISNRRGLRKLYDFDSSFKNTLEWKKGVEWFFENFRTNWSDLRIDKFIIKLMKLWVIEEDWENDTIYSIWVLKVCLKEKKIERFFENFPTNSSDFCDRIEKFITGEINDVTGAIEKDWENDTIYSIRVLNCSRSEGFGIGNMEKRSNAIFGHFLAWIFERIIRFAIEWNEPIEKFIENCN